MHVESSDRRVDVYWDDSPEDDVNPTSQMPGGRDFEGYRVYRSTDSGRTSRYSLSTQWIQANRATDRHVEPGLFPPGGGLPVAAPAYAQGMPR